uniref:MFSD2 lysolipid transporter B, sphingolipid n=1 Tax=Neolamprologus brichardi TaxID=32507 RepID=A0A3Q4HXM2_NEOBR
MSVAFVTANNQEESEVAKLDDARNDCNQPLSTSFSHFLFPGEERVRGQSPRGFCDSHLNSIALFFPPHLQVWLCYSYSGLHCGINSIYSKSCCPSSIICQMVGCTPFLVISYFYLWYVPPFSGSRFIWYLGFYCLYQTLITCFHVPYSALTMFLSTDQKERDSATAYRMTMEVLGTLVGAAIQGQIVASAHTLKHCPTSNMSAGYLGNSSGKQVYTIAAGVIGGVFVICTVVMFLGVKERDDPYAPKTEKQVSFQQAFVLVMRHGPYLSLTAAFLFITVAIQLIQSNFVLFCTYAADLRDHFQNIVLTILVSAVISIPLWQWFLQRFGKKTAAFCGITVSKLWILPFTLMLVFIPNVIVAYVVAVSSGLTVAASLLLPWSMLPDVVDDFRLANPYCKGHEAIFYSFYVFFTKFASGISLGVSTLCLEFAGYDTGACKQPPPVVYTLKLLIGAAPVAFIVTGLMILLLYPITEDVRLRNKATLHRRSTLWL